MKASEQRLLGRLAELSWFTANGEVAATRSLAMLLETSELRSAVERFVYDTTGVDVSSVHRYLAESVHSDLRRPDVEGVDRAHRPLLVVEAKFQAELAADQVASYLEDQSQRLASLPNESGGPSGALLVLVPAARTATAVLAVETAVHAREKSGLAAYPIAVHVVTWDQLLAVLVSASAQTPQLPDSVAADVEQYRALCLALGGLVVEPLGEAGLGAQWRSREDGLRAIVDQASRKLNEGERRLWPIGDEGAFLARRYFPIGHTRTTPTAEPTPVALGIQADFADEGESPVWLRIHKTSPGFEQARDALRSSRWLDKLRSDDGQLWVRLEVDPSEAGPELVASLVVQTRAVQAELFESGAFTR